MGLTLFDVGHELKWLAQARGRDLPRLELIFPKLEERFEAVAEEQASGTEALDPTLFPEQGTQDGGGYVFFWEDVLVLDELLGTIGTVLQEPEQAAALVVHLFQVWQRLRAVRIPLDKEAYRVLAAIKAGHSTVEDIVKQTKYSAETVHALLQTLANTEYEGRSGRLPLVRRQEARWVTPF
jgi:hypothetical protein